MELSTLKTFIEVARLGSFSRAAEALHVTQPAVSKRVTRLEDDLATLLFERIGKEVILTQAGEVLLSRAQDILNHIDETQRLIHSLSEQVNGSLNLATSHHIGLHHLPAILRNYTRQFPQVSLKLHFLASETACQQVAQGMLDLAIVTLPKSFDKRLQCTPVWQDPLVFVCDHHHPLTQHSNPGLKQLAGYPAILPGTNTTTRQLIEQVFTDAEETLFTSMETNYLETIKKMVSIGLGWSALPETMLDQSLYKLTPRNAIVSRQLGVVQHTARTPTNAAREMLTLLHQAKHS